MSIKNINLKPVFVLVQYDCVIYMYKENEDINFKNLFLSRRAKTSETELN